MVHYFKYKGIQFVRITVKYGSKQWRKQQQRQINDWKRQANIFRSKRMLSSVHNHNKLANIDLNLKNVAQKQNFLTSFLFTIKGKSYEKSKRV